MLMHCRNPLSVLLQDTPRSKAELPSDILNHRAWHCSRIRQERSEEPDRAELDRESQPIVLAAPLRNQPQVRVIEIEETLQILLHEIIRESPEPAGLLITQELHRHPTHATEPCRSDP